MSFHIGQKVVCVDDSGRFALRGGRVGSVYTIARVGLSTFGTPAVDVIEVKGRCAADPNWYCTRFRPLIERKTDISIFTAMLTPKQLERVER